MAQNFRVHKTYCQIPGYGKTQIYLVTNPQFFNVQSNYRPNYVLFFMVLAQIFYEFLL